MSRTKRLIKRFLVILIDVIIVTFSSVISMYAINTGVSGNILSVRGYYYSLLLNALITVTLYSLLHMYQGISVYIGIYDALKLLVGDLIVCITHLISMAIIARLSENYLLNYILLFTAIFVLGSIAFRFMKRAYLAFRYFCTRVFYNKQGVPIIIVGAGDAGVTLLREIQNSDKIDYTVKCFVDDNVAKLNTYISEVKVEGTRNDIPALVEKYGAKEIYIAMPSCDAETIQEITDICNKTSCKVKSLPGIYQFVDGEISIKSYREISIEDLLARKAVKVDLTSVLEYVKDKVVMVTGGGGSIGSELCRQIASHDPYRLIIVDIYENNAYDIQQELIEKYPDLHLTVLIASVRDEKRMERIFQTYRPQIVYHAAAHKHVPLMEESPNEAIKNNVFGTFKTASLADKYNVKKFVLISTDKAVNPTNVMGATKRMCEMVVQSLNKNSNTEFVAVRFGNVLGSNGSVVPLFKKQIAAGGPVLVTHPDIIRYFMTIPEAVSLVIQAGAYAHGGEIFVLDMGKPVKILDLAENLIKLSGYVPYKDIDIVFTGLRPGEKLYEEMLMEEEGLQDTENKLIHIGKPIDMDETKFFAQLEKLKEIIDAEPTNTRKLISEIVPTYKGNVDLQNV